MQIGEREHVALLGANGCGKSQRIQELLRKGGFYVGGRKLHAEDIKYVSFCDNYGGDVDRAYFLQQRWNQMEIIDDIVSLSSGELRNHQIGLALQSAPRLLIIDNPFIGLDAQNRDLLVAKLQHIADQQPTNIVLVVSKKSEIPDFITRIDEMESMPTAEEYDVNALLSTSNKETTDNDEAFTIRHATIQYGARTILRDLSWSVKKGEKWALKGCNGSGKSTLLSLICADNPQSYACDISLFGRQRGSGESIWDIKKHIGYVSPELQRAYRHNIPCLKIVASGLKDTVGLYVKTTDAEAEQCRLWLRAFGIEALAERSFMQISSGEQRLVLLARAFVKNPDLLILDEPMHGLDDHNRLRTMQIIEAFCRQKQKTVIMVSHYEEDFPSCIDHVFRLEKLKN